MPQNILIFTGNGKGKSTAAFGMALRASGHNQRVLIIQFIKNDSNVGEIISLKKLGITVTQTGLGFVPKPHNPRYADHQQAAQAGLALADNAMQSGNYDLIILDEICGGVARGLIDEQAVISVITKAPAALNIVLTGRNATAGLIDLADTVSEITPLKHAFDQGIKAREGIEF